MSAELSRDELLAQARALGIEHPQDMTLQELHAALERVRRAAPGRVRPVRATSWFEVARQLLAAVVEQGLNMPDAAALIRGETRLSEPPRAQPPLATVTLAKIYAAQGHAAKALKVLADVLASEPDHPEALDLKQQLHNRQPQHSSQQQAEAQRRRGLGTPDAAAQSDEKGEPGRAEKSETAAQSPQPSSAQVAETPLASEEQVAAEQVGADEADLPPGPADALLALRREGSALMIAWELSAQTEAVRREGGVVEIEWTEFTPTWNGPERHTRHIAIDRAVGSLPAPRGATLNLLSAALGLRQGHKVAPLATLAIAEVDASDPAKIALSRVREFDRAIAESAAQRAVQRISL